MQVIAAPKWGRGDGASVCTLAAQDPEGRI